jgi:hypothetical protein
VCNTNGKNLLAPPPISLEPGGGCRSNDSSFFVRAVEARNMSNNRPERLSALLHAPSYLPTITSPTPRQPGGPSCHPWACHGTTAAPSSSMTSVVVRVNDALATFAGPHRKLRAPHTRPPVAAPIIRLDFDALTLVKRHIGAVASAPLQTVEHIHVRPHLDLVLGRAPCAPAAPRRPPAHGAAHPRGLGCRGEQ